MPTDAENTHYLYLLLTHDGIPSIDWTAVGAAMDLKSGAVSKRWSRLKQSMEKGETPAASCYPFLWLCVKHNKRDKLPNWADIAVKCNTTPGAVSKRFSRMKQAFEQDAPPPTSVPRSPVKNTSAQAKPPTSTPKTNKTATPASDDNDNEDEQLAPTPTPKRKRATPAKQDHMKSKPDHTAHKDDAHDEQPKPKRAKAIKVTPKPKIKTSAQIKKQHPDTTKDYTRNTDPSSSDTDTFHDAEEHITHTDRLHSWLEESV